jgi:hypothetical protein
MDMGSNRTPRDEAKQKLKEDAKQKWTTLLDMGANALGVPGAASLTPINIGQPVRPPLTDSESQGASGYLYPADAIQRTTAALNSGNFVPTPPLFAQQPGQSGESRPVRRAPAQRSWPTDRSHPDIRQDQSVNDTDRKTWANGTNYQVEINDLPTAMRKVLKETGIDGLVWQGVGTDRSSNATHFPDLWLEGKAYGGAADINLEDPHLPIKSEAHRVDTVRNLRRHGIMAYYRVAKSTPTRPDGVADFTIDHIHMVDPGVPNLRDEKLDQILGYLNDKSGLKPNAKNKNGIQNWPDLQQGLQDKQSLIARLDDSNRRRLHQLYGDRWNNTVSRIMHAGTGRN